MTIFMRIQDSIPLLLFATLCMSGCQQRTLTGPMPVEQALAPATPVSISKEVAPQAAAGVPATTRSSHYTELKDCRLVEAKPEEAGYRLTECSGPAGHALRVVEADGRFNVMVRVPEGSFTSLRLSELGGGGFSKLGPRIEWRGAGEGKSLVPDMLVLRYAVADDPAHPARETSYLIAVALKGKQPCVAALVKPGAQQSEKAHRIADAAPACLARD